MQQSNYKKGLLAEKIASIYLFFKGYTFLSHRENRTKRKTGTGEIDLILRKNKTIIFCEVKYRKTIKDALYAISDHQQKRMRRGAELFLKKNPKFKTYDIRLDVIAMAPWK
ncbi:MAG: YraN family protein, partial [Alphaproteobacteria bacterium]|nr:YraN family protein [Alphaproteobacteria bacterium]